MSHSPASRLFSDHYCVHKEMLAPRKTLWSTPTAAIEQTSNLIQLTSSDTLYDVGCGDGRVIIHLASATPCRRFVGIEIDEGRAQQAQCNVDEARKAGRIPEEVSILIRRANALEVDYSEATAVFLYLVPRGLRLIKPILLQRPKAESTKKEGGSDQVRVVTYMSPFADVRYVKKELCTVGHQEGAAWPIYLYHLGR